ncbi:hypothetical protein ACFWXK_39250 [Streptomyces sp. NPDC059070]|uniref:hypothetical protein n=1 Tax=Streptomyces sp. NPDC059070 TaxID=3346713 RepID=UPI0036ADE88D
MAARREKISRWESGQITPELTAQLAIAHIHQVAEETVVNLRWPDWLHAASGDGALLNGPWTCRGAIENLRDVRRLAGQNGRSYFLLSGLVLHVFTEQWNEALTAPPPEAFTHGHPVTPETVLWARARVAALEDMARTVSPSISYLAARGDLRLFASLLSEKTVERQVVSGLLGLAARVAGLCGSLSVVLGEGAAAERYYLAGTRAAAAAGHARASAAHVAGVAYSHLLSGAPQDVPDLVDAVRARSGACDRTTVLLHFLSARAHARLGDATTSAQALDRANTVLAALTSSRQPALPPCLLTRNLDAIWSAACAGIASLHLGRPKQALQHFAPLLNAGVVSQYFPLAARELLFVVDTLLALGEVEAAVDSAHNAVAFYGDSPATVTRMYRGRFTAYRAVPAVRELFSFLDATDC